MESDISIWAKDDFSIWRLQTMERMNPDMEFDVDRYRKLLAEAVDETKRLALIDLLIEERAKERLEAEVAADRAATTVRTIAAVLSISRG